MKTNVTKSDKWRVTSDKLVAADGKCSRHPSPVTRHPSAFTLVELLVVIAIIGVLAALLMPLGAAVKKNAYVSRTKAEMSQVQTAIESYKTAYGFYPPDNPNNPLANQLYYELIGTTNTVVNGANTCVTLDSSAQIPSNQVVTVFNTGGFINCNSANKSAEDSRMARSFLSNLKPQQVATNPVNGVSGVALLVGSVGGPDLSYQPLGASGLNPWRYNSSNPTNNPGAYDLYIQLVIGGKTNLICNWSKQVQVNSPLP
jgi:prepilin-type N-terminal cleavage/methylation domain-containing protein